MSTKDLLIPKVPPRPFQESVDVVWPSAVPQVWPRACSPENGVTRYLNLRHLSTQVDQETDKANISGISLPPAGIVSE